MTDCSVVAATGATKNGVYEVNGTGIKDVYCDLETDGGGWTVCKYQYNNNNKLNLYTITIRPCVKKGNLKVNQPKS